MCIRGPIGSKPIIMYPICVRSQYIVTYIYMGCVYIIIAKIECITTPF